MNRIFAVLQMGLAALLAVVAVITLVNMVLIAPRSETISVVNSIIGQTVMIVCLLALARLLFYRGRERLTDTTEHDSTTREEQDNRS